MNDLHAEVINTRGEGGTPYLAEWHGGEKDNRLRRDQTLALLYGDELVRLDVGNRVLPPAGPEDFEADRLAILGLAQPESDRQLALREVARPIWTIANCRTPLFVFSVIFAPMPSRFDRVPTVFTRSMSFWLALSLRSRRAGPLLVVSSRSRSPSRSKSRICRPPAHDSPPQRRT